MIHKLFPTPQSIVDRVTVMVSEYSEANGGSDCGTLYLVEVMFPDGKWWSVSHHRVLAEARAAARAEARAPGRPDSA